MTFRTFTLFSFVSLLTIGAASSLWAQEVATWSASIEQSSVKPGEQVLVKVRAVINEKWHIYSATPMEEGPEATSIEFSASSALKRKGAIRQPKPIVKFDEAFSLNTEFFEKKVTFSVPAVVKSNAKPGEQKAVVEVTFMACNDRLCIPPKTIEVPLSLTVGEADPGSVAADETADDTTATIAADTKSSGTSVTTTPPASQSLGYGDQGDVERARSEGLWAYIGLAMSVGALSLLTPCVFPMIPITVSFFTKREQATRGRSVRDALIYSFGIIFTFTVLGILLAVFAGASGINEFAANPWINVIIALIFIVFALNLFGLFEIVVPSGILTKLTERSGSGQGIVSLLLMGLTFTLTSFTCTVPFIGTVMVAAASGEIWWSVVGMLAFSTVFAFPFFLLALFPSWLKSMPKSGGWLNSVKVVMGFLELAAAMKFLSNVDLILSMGILSRDLFLSFWVGIGAITTSYLLGLFQLPHDSKVERIGVMRMMFSVFFLGITVFLYTGLGGKPLGEIDAFLPPIQYQETIEAARGSSASLSSEEAGGTKDVWMADYAKALEKAKAESKPVFIDFTGFSCTNCRWMEANIFTRGDVKSLLDKFVMVRLYTDGRGEQYDRNRVLQESRFGTVALPLYVIMSSDDTHLGTFPGLTRKPEEFVSFLQAGLRDASKKAS
ncbi:MAG: thioredoxin family protein [Ignavibacteriae bacterium]|nr:thioredoxin family protein [Ignavibacteriota bacterium]